jgi:hypothetical protein
MFSLSKARHIGFERLRIVFNKKGGIFMKEPYFKPWIGKNYESGEPGSGKKVWILMESHYMWEQDEEKKSIPCSPDATQLVHKNYLKGEYDHTKKGSNIWENILRAFVGSSLHGGKSTFEERESFWQSVMSSNFVQTSVDFGTRPTPTMWEEAKEPFLTVMDTHRPQRILCVGYGVFDHLPCVRGSKWGPSFPELDDVGAKHNCTWIIPFEGIETIKDESDYALVFPVRHASAYFSHAKFHNFVRAFLDIKNEDVLDAWNDKKVEIRLK